MESVTLSGNDFKIIHNTLCDLRGVVQKMTHSMVKVEEVQRIVEQFESGLRDAYAQDNSTFDRKCAYFQEFKRENGLSAVWSIFDLDEHGFLFDHPYQGATEVCYRDHWGEAAVYETIEGNTWADLYRAADRCIQRSGDQHHIFIEHFYPVEGRSHQLRLSTGS